MYTPVDLFAGLDQTFGRSALIEFRRYLAQRPAVTKWIISSDYCLHDKTKHHDVFAYTLFPYDDEFATLQREVRSASTNDLKGIKTVSNDMIEYLGDERRFHVCFLVHNSSKVFSEAGGQERRNAIRESIAITLQQLRGLTNAALHRSAIQRFNELNQYATKNAFDAGLIEDMYLASIFAAYLCVQLVREAKPTIIGWFSDRDKITTTAAGAVFDWFHFNLHGFLETHGVANLMPKVVTPVANPATDESGRMWYDDLVRVPDFFAGTVASWDYDKNLIPGDQPKYRQLVEDVIADHPSLVVLQVYFGDGNLACSRRTASKQQD